MMYYNDAKCDIYIGKGAGSKLMKDIEQAKQSVKIVSPYISNGMLSKLIKLKTEKNIGIELITLDDEIYKIFRVDQDALRNLFIQECEVDIQTQKKCATWIKISKGLFAGVIVSIILATLLLAYNTNLSIFLAILPTTILLLSYIILKAYIRKKKIFNYKYSTLFPLKLNTSNNKYNNTFIHSKIYIIDDPIAYLGSLNFTEYGMRSNCEARIRTEDDKAVKEIIRLFDELLNDSPMSDYSITGWGKRLYKEPINDFPI